MKMLSETKTCHNDYWEDALRENKKEAEMKLQ